MRILFDGWFSQAYNFIEQIREGYNKDIGDNNLFILGTHDKYMGWMELCDEFKIRDSFNQQFCNSVFYANDAFEFYKSIVEEYKIDVIFSKTINSFSCNKYKENCSYINDKELQNNIDVIDTFFKKLNTLDCKIIRDSVSPMLSNKLTTYNILRNVPKLKDILPSYTECYNMKHVSEFYDPSQNKLVLKTELGDGAKNIQIKEFPFNFEFNGDNSNFIMDYLSDEEISLDCLQVEEEFVCVPRKKNKINRTQYVLYKDEYYEELRNYCKSIQIKFDLQMPFNVQFKLDNSSHYLLEINPRLSAGSSMCHLLGVNFPWLTLKKLFNIPIFKTELDWMENICVSYYEKPIFIEKGD